MQITSEQLLKFSGSKSVPLILQSEMAECGLASLAMVASYTKRNKFMIICDILYK
jgi:hypothetical protein